MINVNYLQFICSLDAMKQWSYVLIFILTILLFIVLFMYFNLVWVLLVVYQFLIELNK